MVATVSVFRRLDASAEAHASLPVNLVSQPLLRGVEGRRLHLRTVRRQCHPARAFLDTAYVQLLSYLIVLGTTPPVCTCQRFPSGAWPARPGSRRSARVFRAVRPWT